MSVPRRKRILATALDLTCMNHFLLWWQKRFRQPFIRAINYHATPALYRDELERHLQFYRKHFSAVRYDDLLTLSRGDWPHANPGLIISFDDGYRDNVEVAAPLLEKYGFVGWFFVPVGFIDSPHESQIEYARSHEIRPVVEPSTGHRVAMTWDQVRDLADRHVVGCHTYHHQRLRATLDEQELDFEISHAKRKLEEKLGRDVRAFAWVGGEEWSYSASAARTIKDAGYQVGFMTNNSLIRPGENLLQLQRTNVESSWHRSVVRFQLCGFLDLTYAPKRRRVNQETLV